MNNKRVIFFVLLLVSLLNGVVQADNYRPGKATKSTLDGDNSCVIGSSGGTTGACYVYYHRDVSGLTTYTDLPSRPIDSFTCASGVCSFYLQYADDVVDIGINQSLSPSGLRKCDGGAYKIIQPVSGATGTGAAMYAIWYGAMLWDRPIVITVDTDCIVTTVRLIETVVRDFK